jgi:4'-phosphopantetheinyl transferase
MPVNAEDAWAPGPPNPLLAPRAVHVWRADLTAATEEVCELLCEEESARAERMLRERNRELWRRSRGLLRELLGRYLQRDPRSLRFIAGPHGKPALVRDAVEMTKPQQRSPIAPADVTFNVSHSDRLALYAFAHAHAVGVDVEVARRALDEVAIAARTFGPAEAARLQGLDPAIRQREFQRAWVRHEAELKCLGVGLAGANAVSEGPRPWIAQLEIGPSAEGAVAVACSAPELSCWEWRG